MKKKYHHVGIPNEEIRQDEIPIPAVKAHVTNAEANPYGIEWIRFEADSPMPNIVKRVPHVGFMVDDIDAMIEGKMVIVRPFEPLPGLKVAFILENGAPIEFLQRI